jgi:hypothetical protein
MGDWKASRKDMVPASFVHNIILCEIDASKLLQDFPGFIWATFSRGILQKQSRLVYVAYKEADIQKYKNRPLISTKSWKIPPKVCLYTCLREPGSLTSKMIFDLVVAGEWLFYAAGSPLWKTRIQKYDGIVDYEEKRVRFSDEDLEEAFYNLYNLEPDEQPKLVINRWLGNFV